MSPKDLRFKQKIPPRNGYASPEPFVKTEFRATNTRNNKSAIDSAKPSSTKDPVEPSAAVASTPATPPQAAAAAAATSNGSPNSDDINILKQQNSRSSTPVKKANTNAANKVYFREENVENLTWDTNNSSFDGEDPDASTSPKVNPYSSSFLNFLGGN